MKQTLVTKLGVALLGCALLIPVGLLAQDRGHHDGDNHHYYDKRHKDYHDWNAHEDLAYHRYWQDRHRQYVEFNSLNERQRQSYWAWRHNHSDAVWRIDIR